MDDQQFRANVVDRMARMEVKMDRAVEGQDNLRARIIPLERLAMKVGFVAGLGASLLASLVLSVSTWMLP